MSELQHLIRARGSAALLDGALRYESLNRCGSRFELHLRPSGGHEPLALLGQARRVVEMLLLGHAQKEIAFDMELSVTSVSTLMRLGLRRLGVPCWQHMLLAAAFLDRAAMPPQGARSEGWEWDLEADMCVLTVELSSALLLLTAAEREVVLAAADGSSNEEIACGTKKSVRTVANQLASAFKKLGARGRVELLRCIAQQSCSFQ